MSPPRLQPGYGGLTRRHRKYSGLAFQSGRATRFCCGALPGVSLTGKIEIKAFTGELDPEALIAAWMNEVRTFVNRTRCSATRVVGKFGLQYALYRDVHR